MADDKRPATLAPPAVTALKQGAAGSPGHRHNMERTVSQDMRNERADLKEAAEHSLNIIMDLDLEGKIRYVSPSWADVIGTLPNQVMGKPVLDLICSGGDGFAEAIESVRKDDSRSHIARFTVQLGPHSILRQRRANSSYLPKIWASSNAKVLFSSPPAVKVWTCIHTNHERRSRHATCYRGH